MRVREIAEFIQPSLKTIQIQVPQQTQQLMVDLIQQLANQITGQGQLLTPEQLQIRIDAAQKDKMRRLALAQQNRQIWNAGNIVSPDDKSDALAISKGEPTGQDITNWQPVDNRGKR